MRSDNRDGCPHNEWKQNVSSIRLSDLRISQLLFTFFVGILTDSKTGFLTRNEACSQSISGFKFIFRGFLMLKIMKNNNAHMVLQVLKPTYTLCELSRFQNQWPTM